MFEMTSQTYKYTQELIVFAQNVTDYSDSM